MVVALFCYGVLPQIYYASVVLAAADFAEFQFEYSPEGFAEDTAAHF